MENHKTLNSLTPDDLTRRPCWKHFMAGDLEFVSPSDQEEISENDIDNYIVLTQFVLQDKTEFIGFCSPQETSGLDYIQPVIITKNGHLPLYVDSLENKKLADLTMKIMNKHFNEIFPVRFITNVKCDGQFFHGQINNFNILAD